MPLGPTGKFPKGKMNKQDEGELKIAIFESADKVVINFGKAVTWVGLDADGALEFAEKIKEKAQLCKLNQARKH